MTSSNKINKRQPEVVVALEHRFYQYEGDIYTRLAFAYEYWQDYLSEFDEVKVFARCKTVNQINDEYQLVTGNRVFFIQAPYYRGPLQFGIKLPAMLFRSCQVGWKHQRFILRSGNVCNLLWPFLMLFRKPYLREYPGSISEGVVGYVGNRNIHTIVLAGFLDWMAKVQARFSKANSFVSQCIAKQYSNGRNDYVFSSVAINEVGQPKFDYAATEDLHLVTVGRVENEKGHRFLIEALKELENARVTVIGDGSRRKELEALASDYDLNVDWRGTITNREQLFALMKSCDVFVLPSLTEGMPRALIEAMAVGLPCVATDVGGVPEILPQQFMAKPRSAVSLAEKIAVFSSEDQRRKAGCKNREIATTRFGKSTQDGIKSRFWQCLLQET